MASRNHLVEAAKNPSAALDYEIAQEIASTLGRLGRKLEQSLNKLAALEAGTLSPQDGKAERAKLIAEARSALWNFIVQREACGLRDARQVMIDYRVPPEVQQAVAVPPVTRRRVR
ncbi:MAG TPA: DUF6665 family protein [Xanthobacteraceae bacterium]|jgi:hypothetical protein|nr:DUF6665 family protein [Xanthobacteraceae bacterium]